MATLRSPGQISKRTWWIIIFCVLGSFLFYWYEIRPISTYRACTETASTDARKLLATKASLATEKGQADFYKQLVAKNMYLRKDYESFLSKCLLHYGLPVPSIIETGTGAVDERTK